MKMMRNSLLWAGVVIAAGLLSLRAEEGSGVALRNNDLPSGPAQDVLPQGAVLQVEFNRLYGCLLNLEKFAKSIVPDKALPPDQQSLLQSDHPLLTILGAQIIQEPLTADKIQQVFGLDPERPVTITLYPGDPRRLFVLSLPMANPEALTSCLRRMIPSKSWEEVSFDSKKAVRIELADGRFLPELYVVCSDKQAFLCGDRALAVALHYTPSSQRLNTDAFMNRTIQMLADQDLGIVFNPSLIKPFLLQAQTFRFLAVPLLHAQRENLLRKVPPQVRERLDVQLNNEMGVKDLEQLADYAECVILASFNTLCDAVSQKVTAFQGLSLGAKLDAAFPQLVFRIHSQEYQPGSAPGISVEDIRKATAWLGKDYDCFTVQGNRPELKPSPRFIAWLQQVRNLAETKGLKSPFLDRLQTLEENKQMPQPLETRVSWVLSTHALVNSPPDIRSYQHLDEYLRAFGDSLGLPMYRPVTLLPGKGTDFLEGYFKQQVEARNHNKKAEAEFAKQMSGKTPFLESTSRFRSEEAESNIARFTVENAITTRSGFFGYDQHELVNRKIYLARQYGDYLVMVQGPRTASWLSKLDRGSNGGAAPALTKLLDRVPDGVNSLCVARLLNHLPGGVNWLASLEDLIHTDLDGYLDRASKIYNDASSPEAAKDQVQALKMPMVVYSLNRDPETKKLYCLLPGNLVYPRQKVTTVLKDVIADYAAKAQDVGGSLVYTRIRPEVWECSIVQSTEGIASFIHTVGNTLIEHYLGSPEKQQELRKTILAEGDASAANLDQIVLANPRWEFLPKPRPQKTARPTADIPNRDDQTSKNQVDLSSYYNASLTESWHAGGVENNTLKSLPQGVQEFGGTKFDVRGIVQLAGKGASQLSVKFPREVKGIKVGSKGSRLQFLHATGWPSPDGTKIGCFKVHYTNGEVKEVPIIYGETVRDWWGQGNEPENASLSPVWQGDNTATNDGNPKVRLFKTTWENPLPDTEIETVDYCSEMAASAPFLIAITVE